MVAIVNKILKYELKARNTSTSFLDDVEVLFFFCLFLWFFLFSFVLFLHEWNGKAGTQREKTRIQRPSDQPNFFAFCEDFVCVFLLCLSFYSYISFGFVYASRFWAQNTSVRQKAQDTIRHIQISLIISKFKCSTMCGIQNAHAKAHTDFCFYIVHYTVHFQLERKWSQNNHFENRFSQSTHVSGKKVANVVKIT